MNIGKNIAEMRRARAISQTQLSKSTRLAVPYISRIEHSRLEPSLRTLRKISAALQVSLTDLLDGKDIGITLHRCPISVTGACMGERVFKGRPRYFKIHIERYSSQQLELLRLCYYLVSFGKPTLLDTLINLLECLLRSRHVRKDPTWLRALHLRTNGRKK